MSKLFILFSLALLAFACGGETQSFADLKPFSKKGNLHFVCEIPAGTSKLFKFDRDVPGFKVERIEGIDKKFEFLAFPFNYGFIPSTKTDFTVAGKPEPLSAILLSETYSTSSLLETRIAGMLSFTKAGKPFDVLITIPAEEKHRTIEYSNDLSQSNPKLISILIDYLEQFDGFGKIEYQNFLNSSQAEKFLESAIIEVK